MYSKPSRVASLSATGGSGGRKSHPLRNQFPADLQPVVSHSRGSAISDYQGFRGNHGAPKRPTWVLAQSAYFMGRATQGGRPYAIIRAERFRSLDIWRIAQAERGLAPVAPGCRK